MRGLLAKSVDQKRALKALDFVIAPGDHASFLIEKLEALLKVVRAIEHDIGADVKLGITGKRPQQQRKQFLLAAKKLEEASQLIEELKIPTERFVQDPDRIPRTKPVGLVEFRAEMANQMTLPLSRKYLLSHGVEVIQFNRDNVSAGPINTWNIAFAIAGKAEEIAPDILNRLAKALRDAERKIAANTKSGGPRHSQIQSVMLINIIAMWHKIHANKKIPSYNRGKTNFFCFCQEASGALGAANLCSEAHLRAAVESYKKKNLPETQAPTDRV